MNLRAAAATDRGGRDHNEDTFLLDLDAGLFLVADGMGGLAAGEVASRLAVETVARALAGADDDTLELFPDPNRQSPSQAATRLSRAFSQANAAICAESRTRFGPSGPPAMGSTLVGLLREGDGFVLANVGDSRAYVFRQGGLTQLSEDHSLVMARVRQGLLRPDEALRSPDRHVIYRALGMAATVEVDVTPVGARPGDLFLLCSDGLSDVLDGEALAAVLAGGAPEALEASGAAGSLDSLGRELIATANRLATRDNVTVLLVAVTA